jgi:hypothetical protein
MSPLIHRFIAANDFTPDQSWRLAEWCHEQGADEFALAMLSLDGSSAAFLNEAEAALKPFERSSSPRRALTVLVGEPAVQPRKLWALTPESLSTLKRLFKAGLFTVPSYHEVGWLEDPTFYRDGEVMLGVVSHEREGLLAVTELEHSQLIALGMPTRDRAEWI